MTLNNDNKLKEKMNENPLANKILNFMKKTDSAVTSADVISCVAGDSIKINACLMELKRSGKVKTADRLKKGKNAYIIRGYENETNHKITG